MRGHCSSTLCNCKFVVLLFLTSQSSTDFSFCILKSIDIVFDNRSFVQQDHLLQSNGQVICCRAHRTEVCWNGLYLVGPVYSRAKKAHANTINPGVLTFHLIAQSFILRQSCCIWSPLSDFNIQASYSGVF